MEGTANIVIYHNSEVVRNTYESVSFACENIFSFVVLCTITFMKLQYGICQSIEVDILKGVTNILYRSPIVVFGSLIQFEVMPIIDETSIQRMFHIHQQTQVQHPRIDLCIEFEHIVADEVQHDKDVQDDRAEAYLGMNNDSDEEFEATYEAGDEDEDDDGGGEVVATTLVVPAAAVSQPIDVPPFMRILDLDVMHAPEFSNMQTYNGRHTCFMGTISQDHFKLDSDTIVEDMKSLVESNPSIKVKFIISEVQARFNYTVSCWKTWLAKQKSIVKVFGGWKESY
ncbi:hypothetical protein Ahy_B03g066713 [Arachis hypogaea]|uniref:Transposase MuDR plant domain-containing protein n=1 Tax=Arachis hypogaea TaxID=3818 RepID=A0A445A4S3_ARAHY|nr:hypothetical protein Ahy_B03g066713 [Arachis hypogaea]